MRKTNKINFLFMQQFHTKSFFFCVIFRFSYGLTQEKKCFKRKNMLLYSFNEFLCWLESPHSSGHTNDYGQFRIDINLIIDHLKPQISE